MSDPIIIDFSHIAKAARKAYKENRLQAQLLSNEDPAYMGASPSVTDFHRDEPDIRSFNRNQPAYQGPCAIGAALTEAQRIELDSYKVPEEDVQYPALSALIKCGKVVLSENGNLLTYANTYTETIQELVVELQRAHDKWICLGPQDKKHGENRFLKALENLEKHCINL